MDKWRMKEQMEAWMIVWWIEYMSGQNGWMEERMRNWLNEWMTKWIVNE